MLEPEENTISDTFSSERVTDHVAARVPHCFYILLFFFSQLVINFSATTSTSERPVKTIKNVLKIFGVRNGNLRKLPAICFREKFLEENFLTFPKTLHFCASSPAVFSSTHSLSLASAVPRSSTGASLLH
ncbi:hypothetical protein M9H77_03455 [Catharanthus roseus]|uniref:Uncharacterized protein n=1 Tax=Catharanthus roseus TaxID=4058 RepID=A0ACC0CBK3_CATRO|nr:hypothetical protein M9H77_03455 [Catharanthus roseus]